MWRACELKVHSARRMLVVACITHPPRPTFDAPPVRCNQIRTAGDKDVDDIRTLMEEVDLRIGEAKKSTYEFKRDVVMACDAAAGGGISADRVVRCAARALCRGVRAAWGQAWGQALSGHTGVFVGTHPQAGEAANMSLEGGLTSAAALPTRHTPAPSQRLPAAFLRTRCTARRCCWRR